MEPSATPPGRQGQGWRGGLNRLNAAPLPAKVAIFTAGAVVVALGFAALAPSSTSNSIETKNVEDLDVSVVEPLPSGEVTGQEIQGGASSRTPPEQSGASSREQAEPEVAPCTILVAPGGNDDASGTIDTEPLRSPDAAVDRAGPGDVVCFAPGTYTSGSGNRGALHIQEKNGTPEAPIVFRSADPAARAVFAMGGVRDGAGVSVVFVQRSSHLVFENIEATNGFRGFTVNGSNNIQLLGSHVHSTGGELVYVGKRAGRVQPDAGNNPSSYNVLIEGNEIARSGLADSFGEGIYVATSEREYGDDTNNVTIRNNIIHDVKDEAIDVKTGGYAVSIVDNQIYNVELHSQGAITVAIHGENWNPGGFVVSGNSIQNVTSRGSEAVGIWLGHGDAVIENNVVWNVADAGIYIPNTFNLPEAADVVLRNNTVWSTNGQSVEWGRDWSGVPSGPPNVSFDQSNMTWDGAAGSTQIDSCDLCITS